MVLSDQIRVAISAHKAGQLRDALVQYWRILGLSPRLAGVWHLAGAASIQYGELEKAIGCFQRALDLMPDNSEHHHYLGDALRLAGRHQEAIEAYRKALVLEPTRVDSLVASGNLAAEDGDPAASEYFNRALVEDANSAEALLGLGNIRLSQGGLTEALDLLSRAAALAPDIAATHASLGHTLLRNGETALALLSYRTALELQPDCGCHWRHLASALLAIGQIAEALPAATKAVEIEPSDAAAYDVLAEVLRLSGDARESERRLRQRSEAVAASPKFREELEALFQSGGTIQQALEYVTASLRISPGNAAAPNHLGMICKAMGRIKQAEEAFQIGLRAWPDNGTLLTNYGGLLALAGRADEAARVLERSSEIEPDNAEMHKVRLFNQHYRHDIKGAALVATHREFGRWYSQQRPMRKGHHANDPAPDRPLRIGYLSGDFRDHAVAQFLKPLYDARDRSRFQVVSYSNNQIEDYETQVFRAASDEWRRVVNMDDDALEQLIISDGIDILVDLTGFTHGNRFEVVARKPAPVQALYLGYFATTGTDAIDHYITDSIADPPGAESNYTERLLRLPGCAWCYTPLHAASEVAPLPSANSGTFTYGCLNNPAKYNPAVLAAWSGILHRVPASRLLVYCGWDDDSRQILLDRFAAAGIDPARIAIQGKQSYPDYLASYSQVDLALDPFPYNGGATTCDALWMGVPSVTLAGDLFNGRIGTSLMHHAGLSGFSANTADEYVAIAAEWATRGPQLAEIRRTMRSCMQDSGFLDQRLFMQGVETAYRRIWTEWCEQQSQLPEPGAEKAPIYSMA